VSPKAAPYDRVSIGRRKLRAPVVLLGGLRPTIELFRPDSRPADYSGVGPETRRTRSSPSMTSTVVISIARLSVQWT